MGCLSSSEDNLILEINTSLKIPRRHINPIELFDKFVICNELSRFLSDLAYTSDQAASLAKVVIESIIKIEEEQTLQQNQLVESILTDKINQLNESRRLFPSQIIKMVEQRSQREVKTVVKCKINHLIANLSKNIDLEETLRNQFNVKCWKSNGYKKLSSLEVIETAKYEAIGEHISQLGQKLNFKYLSIKQASESILSLLKDCLIQHALQFESLEYDLREAEVIKIANISRRACQFYENGVYILLVYFVQAARKLAKKDESISSINIKLQNAINIISKIYPPGNGLSEEQQKIKSALRDLEDEAKYDKVIFQYKQIEISPSNKQKQVEVIINNQAKIAQDNQGLLQTLVKQTCLQRCISFKIGLKFNPDDPNTKALTRIKQKLFFNKDQQITRQMIGSIQSVLKNEEDKYLSEIDTILQQKDKISFRITDMVRGKCVFLQITDIIETVNEIKRFIKEDPRFQLAQIESRFTNIVPISDVTLKIILNKEIVTELQLTIQTNAAAYHFAHKIYELHRTKVFSKLKITHNYFQQYQLQVKELLNSAFRIIKMEPSSIALEKQSVLIKYFNLQSVKPLQFRQVFFKKFSQQIQRIPNINSSTDPSNQNFMLTLFCCEMGEWNKQLGSKINNCLMNQQSIKQKAVLLSYFFHKFDISKEVQRMQQFCLTEQQKTEGKIYMEEFLREYFSIQDCFSYISETSKIYYRGHQLLKIEFSKQFQSSPIQMKHNTFVNNMMVDQFSQDNLKVIYQFINFYFNIRKESGQTYIEFQQYYQWLSTIIASNPVLDYKGILSSQSNLLKAQQLLQQNQVLMAEGIVIQARRIFKEKQNYLKVLECELLLVQCYAKKQQKKTLSHIHSYYKKQVKQQQLTLGFQLKGPIVADTLWRISQYLWKQYQTEEEERFILLNYYSPSLIELSRSIRPKKLINALKKLAKQFVKYGIQMPNLRQNNSIRSAKLEDLDDEGCSSLIKAKWKKLNAVNLWDNNIKDKGCEYLNSSNWTQLQTLNLQSNSITSIGCQYLCKIQWKDMTSLNLESNNIGDAGCEYLSKANWKKLTYLNIRMNNVGNNGCSHLSKSDWSNLTTLKIEDNNLQAESCRFLSKANWNKLMVLNIYRNSIGAEGCDYLSRADWNLNTLNIWDNQIGAKGCEYLSKSQWTNLSILQIGLNKIGAEGCQFLSQANWKKMTFINLWDNDIGDKGCLFLSKAEWPSLTTINIRINNIGDLGCEYLSQANWPQLLTLQLQSNSIKAQGCKNLFKSPKANLTTLNLRMNSISEDGCLHLSKAQYPKLSNIFLYGNNIGDVGCSHLSKANWKNIQALNLQNNRIGPLGCKHLAQGRWNKLTTLNLWNNEIGDEGCRYLSSGKWTHLTSLYLKNNNLGYEGCQSLINTNWKDISTVYLGGNNIQSKQKLQVEKKFQIKSVSIKW